MELKHKVEAVLFAVGTKVSMEELEKLTKSESKDLLPVLKQLQEEYQERNSALAIYDEDQNWKLNVRETYLPVVRKIIVRTELPKSVMETLAVLAWKAPMKQSELVEIRSNKTYDHLAELDKMGFIIKKPFGRTKMIELTQKFYDYFELTGKQEILKKFGRIQDKALPQKQIQEYTAEEIAEQEAQKKRELEQRNQELSQEYHEQQKQDESFLDDMDKRIDSVKEQSDKTKSTFDELKPRLEDAQIDQESSEESHDESETKSTEISEE